MLYIDLKQFLYEIGFEDDVVVQEYQDIGLRAVHGRVPR